MLPEEARIADHQRRRFNELVDVFDRPQPLEVMARLREIVSSARLRSGEVVLDVGTGVGVLIPLIQSYQPAAVLACDVAEKMLQRVQNKYPAVRTFHADIASLDLASCQLGRHLYEWYVREYCRQTSRVPKCGTHASVRWASCGQPSRRACLH